MPSSWPASQAPSVPRLYALLCPHICYKIAVVEDPHHGAVEVPDDVVEPAVDLKVLPLTVKTFDYLILHNFVCEI